MKSWIMAARPKTLTAALVPIAVATGLAWPTVDWTLSFYALLCAFFIQIGTNLVNDAIDFEKGADDAFRKGPVRVTQMGIFTYKAVLTSGVGCFLVALLLGMPLVAAGGFPISIILAVSVFCGYIYTGGPYPLAYVGLGDLFVMIFFGWVSTCTLFYLHTGTVTLASFVAGTQIGFLAMVMIAINNLRDVNEDTKVNKRTLAVRFGVPFAKKEILICLFAPFILNLYWGVQLSVLTLPLACFIAYHVVKAPPGKIYNRLLGQSALLHLLFGAALTAGFIL